MVSLARLFYDTRNGVVLGISIALLLQISVVGGRVSLSVLNKLCSLLILLSPRLVCQTTNYCSQ